MLKGVIAATSVAAEALDSAPARMARMNMEVLGIGYAPGGYFGSRRLRKVVADEIR